MGLPTSGHPSGCRKRGGQVIDQLGVAVTVPSGGSVYLSISGEIDATTRDDFARALRDAIFASQRVVGLDLSDVEFIGSDGINVLVRMSTLAAEEGISLRIVKASKRVERVLDLMGLENYFS
jgi:anti-sigma B factor antagonist